MKRDFKSFEYKGKEYKIFYKKSSAQHGHKAASIMTILHNALIRRDADKRSKRYACYQKESIAEFIEYNNIFVS